MYNQRLLMCRPDFFRIAYQINPYMDVAVQPDATALQAEYQAIVDAHTAAGRELAFIEPADAWPDMVYTANVALVRGKTAVMANLPEERAGEVRLARAWLQAHGYETVDCPVPFSGQGDALPTGTGAVIKGRGWRSDPASDEVVGQALGYEVIPVQTVSAAWYDIDLSIGIVRPGVIAVCLDTLDRESQATLQDRSDLQIIPVTLEEAERAALNFVSDGTTVVLPAGAPDLKQKLTAAGLEVGRAKYNRVVEGRRRSSMHHPGTRRELAAKPDIKRREATCFAPFIMSPVTIGAEDYRVERPAVFRD